jgi:hypothetical protein
MMDLQAQDRAHRIGQKNEVRVFRLVTASSIEDKILARATDKKNLNGLVVEAGLVGKRQSGNNTGVGDVEGSATKEMMETLLSEWSAGGVDLDEEEFDEADIADDEQINDLMAIYEGEHELYQLMDKQRIEAKTAAWKEKQRLLGRTGLQCPPVPPPLFDKDEQPSWLSVESWNSKNSGIVQAMMGTLAADGSDERGYDAAGNKRDSSSSSSSSSSSAAAAREPVLIGGKAMRQRKEVQYDDGLTEGQFQRLVEKQEDEIEETRKKAKRAKEEAKHDEIAIAGQVRPVVRDRVMQEIVGLLTTILRLKRSNGHSLCEWFKEKPSKHIFLDYYTLIQNPISLKEIVAGLKKNSYMTLEAVEEDLALMSRNARTYNQDGSEVLLVCEDIRAAFYEGMAIVREKFGLPPRKMPPLVYGVSRVYSDEEMEAAEHLLQRELTEEEESMTVKISINKKRI